MLTEMVPSPGGQSGACQGYAVKIWEMAGQPGDPTALTGNTEKGFSGDHPGSNLAFMGGHLCFSSQQRMVCLLVTPFFSGGPPIFALLLLEQPTLPPAQG